MNSISVRDQSELLRSRSEAAKAELKAIDQAQLERYRNPPASTVYGLEYAFHLLGDISGKTVLDLGCGQGENCLALMLRGAFVLGVDISPELLELARERQRLTFGESELGSLLVEGSAEHTTLPDKSVDVIFCVACVHHLQIGEVQKEMLRILKPGGFVILKEPVRFSKSYAWLRKFFPEQADCSEFEHPLTEEELNVLCWPFRMEELRYFRLPFVGLAARWFSPRWPKVEEWAIKWSARMLDGRFWLEKYATEVVVRLVKT